MDKIAAYDTVLRRHPLWETDYQEKEAGIAAVRAAGSALKGGANTAYKAVGGPQFTGAITDTVKSGRWALKAPGPLGPRLANAVTGARVNAYQAANTPIGSFLKGSILPY
jgi:hypothetical protein